MNGQHTLTETEARELPARVMALIEQHKGARRAIVGAELAHALGYKDDRKVRMVIQQLIADGHPIAASTTSKTVGYYLVETRQEAEAYAASLRSRAVKTFERLRDFERAVEKTYGVPYQPLLLNLDKEA